ncbi:MAG: hypothetical protein ACKVHP_04455 [Verrucomicrobiales bacterium]
MNSLLDLGLPVTEEGMRFFSLKSDYPSDKALHLLGYYPEVSIEEGMQETESWLRDECHLLNEC